MNKNIKDKIHESHGITIIALSVTIIILLILAGITIGTITGNNGIIGKTEEAKKEHEIASWEEKIDTAIIQVEGSKRDANIDDIIQGLIDKQIISDSSKVNRETGVIETNDPVYKISGKLDDYTGVTAKVIANAENKDDYYGKIVENYECPNGEGVNNWLIFYADENNIYLITDDYIHKDYCPGSENYSITAHDTDYRLSMENVINDYPNGSEEITDEKIKNLNKSYFDYLKENGETSTNDNMKAVAYMLDTDVWSVFAGTNAEYAIGGPTIELLFNSANGKNKSSYIAQAISKNGYQIKAKDSDNWSYQIANLLGAKQPYANKSRQKAGGYWLASPSDHVATRVMDVDNNGSIYGGTVGTATVGFCPVVCLNSNVRLQKQENGNYIIK